MGIVSQAVLDDLNIGF